MVVSRCRLTVVVVLLAGLTGWFCRMAVAGEIVVSGAASLTGAMTEVRQAFEAAHPGQKLYVNFASSGQLLQQIEAGAPVDVFAPADQDTMDRAQQHGLIDAASRVDFTANDLMLVVPCDAKDVHCAKDLTDAKVERIALGEPDAVPAGSYTKEALSNLGLWDALSPKMVYGLSVKQALDYVALGEVEAAFIYGTDARLAPDRIRVIANMGGHKPIVYPAAVVSSSAQKDGAREFIDFLTGEPGQSILAKYGFKKPGEIRGK
jgi:molybdate transport system substrate-binding protein